MAAEDKNLKRLLTLTLDTKRLTASELKDGGLSYIRYSWRKLRVYLQRRYGKAIEFIAIVELQKRGVAHLHILVDRYLPYEWVKSAWVSVGGGRIVDIKWVDVHRVSGYLSKYLSKDSVGGLPKRVRRYSVSRGIEPWNRVKSGWSLEPLSLRVVRERAIATRKGICGLAWDVTGKLEMLVLAGSG